MLRYVAEVRRAQLDLHLAVLLFSATAVLGKAISTSGYGVVLCRLTLASAVLLLFRPRLSVIAELFRSDWRKLLTSSFLITSHWVAFYESIKFSNASVAVACIATSAFFTALLDPLRTKSRPNVTQLGLAILAAVGMTLIAGSLPTGYFFGFTLGILAALLVALYGIYTKTFISRVDTYALTVCQFAIGAALLLLFLPLYLKLHPTASTMPKGSEDLLWLVVLATVCTAIPFLLNLRALATLSPFTIGLTFNLEPIYGGALAILIFGENKMMTNGFIVGACIVGLSVAIHSWHSFKSR